jgi:hypothetical protein
MLPDWPRLSFFKFVENIDIVKLFGIMPLFSLELGMSHWFSTLLPVYSLILTANI